MVLTREISEEIKSAINSAMLKCVKDPDFIKTLADSVSESVTKMVDKKLRQIEQKVLDLKNELMQVNKENEDKVNKLENAFKELLVEKGVMISKYDNLEQETRKNNLRIFNYKEKNKENTKEEVIAFLNTKMSINVSSNDIELCYRIGKKENNTRHRGIFLKLKTQEVKQEIYRKKKMLKGTSVVIKEDLTSLRLKMVAKAIEKSSLKDVWTDSGKIYVKFNNKISMINSEHDLKKLFGCEI